MVIKIKIDSDFNLISVFINILILIVSSIYLPLFLEV